MKVIDFLGVLNMRINYMITSRDDRKEYQIYKNNRLDNEVANKNIYMIFQLDDGTLDITVF